MISATRLDQSLFPNPALHDFEPKNVLSNSKAPHRNFKSLCLNRLHSSLKPSHPLIGNVTVHGFSHETQSLVCFQTKPAQFWAQDSRLKAQNSILCFFFQIQPCTILSPRLSSRSTRPVMDASNRFARKAPNRLHSSLKPWHLLNR